MIDLKPTSGRLREHFRYAWWRYVLFTALALAAANILFTVTEPKIPYPQRTEVIILSTYTDETVSQAWEQQLRALVSADQKVVDIQGTTLMEGQDMMIMQVLMARMTGHEGTVMLLPRAMFTALASGGAFADLDADTLSQLSVPEGTDMSVGQVTVGADEETGEAGTVQQAGIPLGQCKGLGQLFVNEDMVLCFPFYAKDNWNNALVTANWLLSKTEAPAAAATEQPQASAAAQ